MRNGGDETGHARSAPRVLDGRCLGVAVESGVRQIAGEIPADPLPLREVAEEIRLRKAAHPHRPLDSLAAPSEGEAPIPLTRDRYASKVEFRRPDAVHLHLARADSSPLLQGRQVHIGKADGALDLPHLVAGEENHGAVGFDPVDGAARTPAIGGRIGEEVHHLELIAVVPKICHPGNLT